MNRLLGGKEHSKEKAGALLSTVVWRREQYPDHDFNDLPHVGCATSAVDGRAVDAHRRPLRDDRRSGGFACLLAVRRSRSIGRPLAASHETYSILPT